MTTEQEGTQQQAAEQTPTTEELLKQTQGELDRYKKLYEEKDRGLKTAHQTLTAKDRELKSQVELREVISGLDQKIRILAAAQATGMRMNEDTLDNMSPQAQQNLLNQFDKLDADTKAKAEQSKKQAEEQEYRTKADTLWQEAQTLGFDEDTLDRVEDSLMYGRLERAERIINKKRESMKETETKPSDQDIDKLVQERVKQELEKHNIQIEEEGLLDTDTAIPSGRTPSQQDIIARYASGDPTVSREDYEKATGGR